MGSTVELAVPFPTPDIENREPRRREEVELTVRVIATAVAPTGSPDGLTPVPRRPVLNALADSMTGVTVDVCDQLMRMARRVAPKSLHAIEAGSVSAWTPGGMSPFQYAHGRELAAAEGRRYDSYGALPPEA